MGKTRTFKVEFKKQVVSQVDRGLMTASEACRKYGLSSSAVSKWRQQLGGGTALDQMSVSEKRLQAQVEKLQAKVGELTMEIDLLKKFRNWSQQGKSANTSVITESNLAQFTKAVKSSESA